jgi:mercuric ion transport protein
MMRTAKTSATFITGLLTAIAASLCCIAPVLAFLGGASGLASSFSWIEVYRPFLIASTILVFAFAWYQKLGSQKQIECGCETEGKTSFVQSKTFLGVVTVFAALAISFPYYSKAFYPSVQQVQVVITEKTEIRQAQFTIKGMTCEGCTKQVNSEIAKLKGVINYETSYEKATSIVKFDSRKTTIESVAAAINLTGYKVVAQTALKD